MGCAGVITYSWIPHPGKTTVVGSSEALAVRKLSLSSRSCHSILKVASTIADLAGAEHIGENHLLEAVQHRRYGEQDYFRL